MNFLAFSNRTAKFNEPSKTELDPAAQWKREDKPKEDRIRLEKMPLAMARVTIFTEMAAHIDSELR
mgnify:CR=1 FL=1